MLMVSRHLPNQPHDVLIATEVVPALLFNSIGVSRASIERAATYLRLSELNPGNAGLRLRLLRLPQPEGVGEPLCNWVRAYAHVPLGISRGRSATEEDHRKTGSPVLVMELNLEIYLGQGLASA